MHSEKRYLAPDPGRFAAMMHRRTLAGYRFDPLPPFGVRDDYMDTAQSNLLAQGFVFRLRDQEGNPTVGMLKQLDNGEATRRREIIEAEFAVESPTLPEGELRDAVRRLVGQAQLRGLLSLRQYRTPRAVYQSDRLVGLLSLDVVAYETGPGLLVTNELKVELASSGEGDDLVLLDAELRDLGLEPSPLTKFERALFRLGQMPDQPLRLLPREREALERLVADPLDARRAQIVLRAAEGDGPDAIASAVDLSRSRVRHWLHAFRQERLGAFDAYEPPSDAPRRYQVGVESACAGHRRAAHSAGHRHACCGVH